MADLPFRSGRAPSHDDISRALHSVRSDMGAYSPDPSVWASPAPTSIQEALDRIAALLYTLNSNTVIP